MSDLTVDGTVASVQQKVWLVMMWDYEQTGPVGVYDSIEAVIAHHPNSHRCEWRFDKKADIWFQVDPKTDIPVTRGYEAQLVPVETVSDAPTGKDA